MGFLIDSELAGAAHQTNASGAFFAATNSFKVLYCHVNSSLKALGQRLRILSRMGVLRASIDF
jgi:hypothetical protein